MSSPLIPLGVAFMRNEYASVVVAYVTYGNQSAPLHLEQSDLPGCAGIYVILAGISMYILLQYRHQTKGRYVLIVYTCSMFIASTIYFGAAAKLTEITLIETVFNPAAFAAVSSKVSMTKNTAYVVNVWLADSLVVCSAKLIV
jgi:hypothetical protein